MCPSSDDASRGLTMQTSILSGHLKLFSVFVMFSVLELVLRFFKLKFHLGKDAQFKEIGPTVGRLLTGFFFFFFFLFVWGFFWLFFFFDETLCFSPYAYICRRACFVIISLAL